MKERLARFMTGRYGNDQLNSFLLVLGMVLAVLGIFLRGRAGSILYVLVLAVLGLSYYRMFSRNLMRRRDENSKYLRLRYKVLGRLQLRKQRWQQRKDYKFFTCPACRATLRVPKGKGKLRIVCRKCGNSFTGKS